MGAISQKGIAWPSVSIGIPTFNSAKHIKGCLDSIFLQDYPGIEVILVDDGSTDDTLEIAKGYPVKVIHTRFQNPEPAKMEAFQQSKGDIFFYLDDDNELIGKDWLQRMVWPMLDNPEVSGTFTHHVAGKSDPAVIRYLSYDLLQRDPMLRHFSVGIEDCFWFKGDSYMVCRFLPERTPPVGLMLHWRKDIIEILATGPVNPARFFDIDLTATMVDLGKQFYAYVAVGQRHIHADGLLHLIRKRVIHVQRGFLKTYPERKFTWGDSMRPTAMLAWVLYANSFIPLLARAIRHALGKRDWVLLYEPVVGLALTDAALWGFLSDRKGRKLMLDAVLNATRPRKQTEATAEGIETARPIPRND